MSTLFPDLLQRRNAKRGHLLAGLAIVAALLCSSLESTKAAPMEFRTASAGGTDGYWWIVADGEIEADTPEAFSRFLPSISSFSNLNGRTEVWLNSPGGVLNAGLELGRRIRKAGLGTVVANSVPRSGSQMEDPVPGKCASACAYAFLGGKWRRADAGTLGVHQFFTEAAISSPKEKQFSGSDLFREQETVGVLAAYVTGMGVDARFLMIASSVSSVHYFSADELTTYDIITDARLFGPWALEEYKGGVIAYSRNKNTGVTATIFCRRDRIMKLMITMPNKNGLSSDTPKALMLMVFGKPIEKSDVTGRLSGGDLMIEVRLPAFEEVDGSKEGFTAYGLAGANQLFGQDIPGKDLARHARIVQRNCL